MIEQTGTACHTHSNQERTAWQVLPVLLLLSLYALGVAHWIFFYRGGDFSLLLDDWKKEYDYYALLQQALETGQIPYHMSVVHHGTDRFLGMPETNLWPHILLLPYVGIVPFFLWHTLVMYTLGFVGCLLIRRRYQLGPTAFTFLFLLFNFNGYITSHLSCGHTMWNGYFLLPFFCLWTLELFDGGPTRRPALLLALVLFAMMLQGTFHHVIWCWLFLLLVALFNPRSWREVLLVLLFSGALSAHRLAPGAVAFWGHSERGFWAGYPTVKEMLDGLIELKEHDLNNAGHPWILSQLKGWRLGWNEYDMYIGLLALAALLYFGIGRRLKCGSGPDEYRYRELDAPMLAMTFLSFNYFYWVVADLPIPLFNAERVSSRFFIIPLVFLMVLSAIHLRRFLEQVRPSAALYVLLIGGLLQTAFALVEHSAAWRIVGRAEGMPAVPPGEPSLVQRADPFYVAVVWLSAGMSLVALMAWVILFIRARPPLTPPPPAPAASGAAP